MLPACYIKVSGNEKKGELVNKLCFSMGGTSIPTSKKPVKNLGKTYNCSMTDIASIQHSSQKVKSTKEVQSIESYYYKGLLFTFKRFEKKISHYL